MPNQSKLWHSSITTVEPNTLTTHGEDQTAIIRNFSYEEMVFLLLLGRKPSEIEAHMLRCVIVSHCSHGITGQSTLAVRMAADTGASFLNAVIGGFSVGSGPYHQGGLEKAMTEIRDAREFGNPGDYVRSKLARNELLYGFGHRFHTFDPRAKTLVDVCEEQGFLGDNVRCVQLMDDIIKQEKGVRMNIEAAGGAILLDLGFPLEVASLVIVIGRAPMLAAAYMERIKQLETPKRMFPKISVYEE